MKSGAFVALVEGAWFAVPHSNVGYDGETREPFYRKPASYGPSSSCTYAATSVTFCSVNRSG